MTKKKEAVSDSVFWQDPFDDNFRFRGQAFDKAFRQAGHTSRPRRR